MSHFYGTLEGCRGRATRRGSKASGIRVEAASFAGAAFAEAYRDDEKNKDMVRVGLMPWNGCGQNKELYDGPIDGSMEIKQEEARLFAYVVDETTNKAKKVNGSVTVTIPREIYDEIKEHIVRKVVGINA